MSSQRVAILLVAFTLLRGVLLAAVYPVLHGPDEGAHLDYVQCLVERPPAAGGPPSYSAEVSALAKAYLEPVMFDVGASVPPLGPIHLPDSTSPAVRASSLCYVAEMYSPLYYWTAAGTYLAAGRDAPLPRRIFAARLASVAWGCIAVLAMFAAGSWFFGGAPGGLLLGASAAAQPQVWFMTSVVNNDAALLACAFTALAAVAAMRRFPTSPYPSVAFAVAALLGVLAKPTLLFYLPALFACAVAGLGASRRAVVQAAALLVPAIVAGVLWLVLHPPPEVAAPVQLSFGQFFQDQVWNGQRAKWLWVTSYWMTWGWADTMLPERYYLLVVAMLAGAAVGLVIGWRLLLTSERAVAALALVVSAYCVVVLYALEYFLMRRTPTAAFIQGRYLLPFLPLVLLAAITGWAAVGRRFRATVDLRWVVPLVLLTLDMAAAIHALHRYHA